MKIITRPLFNIVLVRKLKDDDADGYWRTGVAGEVALIIKPDSAKKREVECQGIVVAKGRTCVDVEVGDHVMFTAYAGMDQAVGGIDHVLLVETEIKAVLEKVDE